MAHALDVAMDLLKPPPPPPDPALPTRADFFANGMTPAVVGDRFLDGNCAFCWDEYNEEHVPVKIQPCEHVYGRGCVDKMVEAGEKKCPICQEAWFRDG